MESHDAIFDKFVEMAGNDGPFQKRFDWIFNAAMIVFASMAYMNTVLALNVPDYWCHVPGREFTNYSIDEWKQITLPKEIDTRGESGFSHCKMYSNINLTAIQSKYSSHTSNLSAIAADQHSGIIDCEVHDYDKIWYESTIVSQEDWVCSKDLYQTNTFVANRIGEALGTLTIGQLGDTVGRKMIYYISIIIIVGGRLLLVITPAHYYLFFGASVIGSLAALQIFQAPFIIGMEIAAPDNRADVAMIQSLAWSLGQCILPLIFWWVREWLHFVLLTTIPLALFLFVPKYMIESPRWLATRDRLGEAASVLNHIGKINGKSINITEKQLRAELPIKVKDKVYGVFSLFSGLRLAKNTVILIICWSIGTLSYFTMILYIAHMDGNPFLNYLYQSAAEVPAYLVGSYMSNTLGRRFTNASSFIFAAIFCVPVVFMATHSEYANFVTCMIMMVKFWSAITYFAVNLQSMETYPTCLRQTGLSCGLFFSNVVGVLGPYIAYLGTKYDMRYPIMILLILFIFGGICALFLPETLHQQLPDSLQEARVFGADQAFWSLPKQKETTNTTAKDDENKNQRF